MPIGFPAFSFPEDHWPTTSDQPFGEVVQDSPYESVNVWRCVDVSELVPVVLRRLGDTEGAIWSQGEIQDYLKEGYKKLTLETGCLWATDIFPDVPATFNYTSDFELEFIEGGWPSNGPFQFTSEFERDYINNAQGPANHNYTWEFDYATDAGQTTEISGLVDLREDLYQIERATWNSIRIDALRSRDLEMKDSRYELVKGYVDAFIQDKDGLRKLRKWRVPSAEFTPHELDDDSEEFGILVDVSDLDDNTPVGRWGDFVQISGQETCADEWGVIVGVFDDSNAVRIEYRKRGADLDTDCFEIPERYTVYVRHYAQARALEREGDGQDLELAAHYQSRYEAGKQRMLQRKSAMSYQQKFVRGEGGRRGAKPPYPKLPYTYAVR